MKKLVLIHPYPRKHFGEENVSVIVQMPLNLGYISAMTPRDEWEVDIIDEVIEPAIDKGGNLTFGNADLVGFTGLTYQSPRLYEIAKACKEAGIPTVAGGCHATIIPEEVMQHCDTIVVGESERIWSTVLEDFKNGNMQRRYDGGPLPLEELKGLYPDRELLKQKYNYKYSSIITTRGCPFLCDFCCVPAIQGRLYRERPPEDVLDELEHTDYRGLMLAEDNFYGYSPKAKERAHNLFRGWVERKIEKDWFGFTSLNVTQDDVVLDLMARSGCLGMLMGIESVNYDTLKQMHKSVNIGIGKKNYGTDSKSMIGNYRLCFDNVHKHGMVVWGSVIFGSDYDTEDTFKEIVDCVWEAGMDVTTFGIYTPMAHTELHGRMSAQRRIFRTTMPEDWYYYNSGHLVFQLKMPLEKFIEGLTYVYENIFSRDAVRERFKKTLAATNNMKTAMFAYRVNLDWKRVFEANLEELHKLYDSGVYPHPSSKSPVAESIPAALWQQ